MSEKGVQRTSEDQRRSRAFKTRAKAPVLVVSMLHSGKHERQGGRSATMTSLHGVQQHTDAATLKSGQGSAGPLSAENAAGCHVHTATADDSAVLGTSQEPGRHNGDLD